MAQRKVEQAFDAAGDKAKEFADTAKQYEKKAANAAYK